MFNHTSTFGIEKDFNGRLSYQMAWSIFAQRLSGALGMMGDVKFTLIWFVLFCVIAALV